VQFSKEQNNEIMRLFHGRCIRCNKRAVTVHEILPRSCGKIAEKFENRVPLCHACHEEIHQHGAINFVTELLRLRREFLEKYGTSQ
jgi:hypothetical protein